MTAPITCLVDLLKRIGLNWRALDCGSRIRALDKSTFSSFESGAIAYPFPYLGQAQFSLVVWPEGQAQAPQIWFLRFALDEQAKLPLSQRDEFLQQLLVAIGSNLAAAEHGERLKSVLDNNPFVWQPNDPLKAAFHARLTATLKLPPSQFYSEAVKYLSQGPWDYWQALGLQGLADVIARLNDTSVKSFLPRALAGVPTPVFNTLSQLLEHEPLEHGLTAIILERLEAALNNNNAAEITACLRAMSGSIATGAVISALEKTLQHPIDTEALVTLTTRHGHHLIDQKLTLPYLECVAQLEQTSFNRLLAELLFQPTIRPHFLAAFRQETRSEQLARAIGGLLSPNNA